MLRARNKSIDGVLELKKVSQKARNVGDVLLINISDKPSFFINEMILFPQLLQMSFRNPSPVGYP